MKVLVVSQNPDERLRATTAMQLAEDVEVVEVDSERAARELAMDEDLDVLVVDGDMAPKGGFSFLYELRARGEQEERSTPPALVMMAREDDRWLAGWSGANRVMLKPVDPFQLARAVRELEGEPAAEREGGESQSQADAAAADLGGTAGLAPER